MKAGLEKLQNKLLAFFFSYIFPFQNGSLLADIFHLSDWKDDLRQGILVDLYFYTLQYPFVSAD